MRRGLTKAERQDIGDREHVYDDATALQIIQDAYLMLKAIPRENWMTEDYSDDHNRCCFVGHYNRVSSDNVEDYSKANCLVVGFENYIQAAFHRADINIVGVNDDEGHAKYTQDHPKDRTMAACVDAMDHLCKRIKVKR